MVLVAALLVLMLVFVPSTDARALKRAIGRQHKSFPLHGSAGDARRSRPASKADEAKKKRAAVPQAASLLRDLEKHHEAIKVAKTAMESAKKAAAADTLSGKKLTKGSNKPIDAAKKPVDAVKKQPVAAKPAASGSISEAVLASKVSELEKQVQE